MERRIAVQTLIYSRPAQHRRPNRNDAAASGCKQRHDQPPSVPTLGSSRDEKDGTRPLSAVSGRFHRKRDWKDLSFTLQGSVVLVLTESPDLHSASPANVLCTASRHSCAPRNLRRRFQRSNTL